MVFEFGENSDGFNKLESLDVGNVRFGFQQKIAGNENDPLVRTATGGRRQFGHCSGSDVYADDGEVA